MLLLPWYVSIIGAIASWFILENLEKKFTALINSITPFANNSRISFTAQEESRYKSELSMGI
jgi:hypothetical protein